MRRVRRPAGAAGWYRNVFLALRATTAAVCLAALPASPPPHHDAPFSSPSSLCRPMPVSVTPTPATQLCMTRTRLHTAPGDADAPPLYAACRGSTFRRCRVRQLLLPVPLPLSVHARRRQPDAAWHHHLPINSTVGNSSHILRMTFRDHSVAMPLAYTLCEPLIARLSRCIVYAAVNNVTCNDIVLRGSAPSRST